MTLPRTGCPASLARGSCANRHPRPLGASAERDFRQRAKDPAHPRPYRDPGPVTTRELSTRMIEAVLDGEGLQGVPELPAAEAGGVVAIVLPPRGLAARAPGGGELNGVAEYAKARVAETEATATEPIALERPIEAGGQIVGVVLLLEEG